MGLYLLRRIYQALLVFLVLSGVVFMILHISGDPVALLMPADATPDQLAEMRTTLGLDKPLWMQYGIFLKNAAQGNLGVSYHHGQPALKLVLERLPASLELVVTTILISLILALTDQIPHDRQGRETSRICPQMGGSRGRRNLREHGHDPEYRALVRGAGRNPGGNVCKPPQ